MAEQLPPHVVASVLHHSHCSLPHALAGLGAVPTWHRLLVPPHSQHVHRHEQPLLGEYGRLESRATWSDALSEGAHGRGRACAACFFSPAFQPQRKTIDSLERVRCRFWRGHVRRWLSERGLRRHFESLLELSQGQFAPPTSGFDSNSTEEGDKRSAGSFRNASGDKGDGFAARLWFDVALCMIPLAGPVLEDGDHRLGDNPGGTDSLDDAEEHYHRGVLAADGRARLLTSFRGRPWFDALRPVILRAEHEDPASAQANEGSARKESHDKSFCSLLSGAVSKVQKSVALHRLLHSAEARSSVAQTMMAEAFSSRGLHRGTAASVAGTLLVESGHGSLDAPIALQMRHVLKRSFEAEAEPVQPTSLPKLGRLCFGVREHSVRDDETRRTLSRVSQQFLESSSFAEVASFPAMSVRLLEENKGSWYQFFKPGDDLTHNLLTLPPPLSGLASFCGDSERMGLPRPIRPESARFSEHKTLVRMDLGWVEMHVHGSKRGVKPRAMHVAPLQAAILLLFNDERSLDFGQIAQRLGCPGQFLAALRAALHGLCGPPQTRVLRQIKSVSVSGLSTFTPVMGGGGRSARLGHSVPPFDFPPETAAIRPHDAAGDGSCRCGCGGDVPHRRASHIPLPRVQIESALVRSGKRHNGRMRVRDLVDDVWQFFDSERAPRPATVLVLDSVNALVDREYFAIAVGEEGVLRPDDEVVYMP
jgi:hypothetical protein